MSKFLGRTYMYNGQEVGVTTGLGDTFITARISPTGGHHRVKSSALPTVADSKTAQSLLDAWAKSHRLSVCTPIANRKSQIANG
jgi:hypothetical protein